MIQTVWPLILRGGAALVLSVAYGCSETSRDISPAEMSVPMLRVDSGTKLVVVLPRDTIALHDNAPVEVHYYVVNGPQRITLDNDPGFYSVRIETSAGRPVRPTGDLSPASGSLGQTRMELPARAILGQLVNLHCIQDGAGYSGGDPAASDACLGSYPLQESGSYRVIIEYAGPEFRWEQGPRSGSTAAVDTGATLKAISNARKMADTAVLVVR